MLILAEEELIAIDLQKEGWPHLTPPYLAPLHSSAITCSTHVANIPDPVWQKIEMAKKSNQNALLNKVKKPPKVSFDSVSLIDKKL